MTTVLAMALLPLVLIPIHKGDDLFNSIAAKHATYLVVTQRLFLATYLARSIHSYATYRHLDPSLMANFYSMELWSAPCKSIFCFLPNTQSRLRKTAKPAKLHALPTFFPVPNVSITSVVDQSLIKPSPPPRFRLLLRSLPAVPPPPQAQKRNSPKFHRLWHHSFPHKRTLRPPPRAAPLASHSNRHKPLHPLRNLRCNSAILSPFSRPAVPISELATEATSVRDRRQQAYQLHDLAADDARVGCIDCGG